MKFLSFLYIFGIDSIERKVLKIFRTIMLALSSLVYEWIIYFYDIFVRLGRAEILTSSQVETIYSRVTLILGIFMLFKMTFSFVQYLLDPEKMSDKSKGASKLVLKAVVVVALLGTCPFIFQQAYKLQGMFLDSNVIGKVILGNDNGDVNTSNFGTELSENLFLTFYTLAEGEECPAAGDKLQDLRDEIKYNRSFWLAAACVNEEPAFKNEFVIDFAGHGIVTLAIGIFVLYIILGYCLSVGMRVVQLAFLQLIAPIPILSYLGEDKDGAFSKWVKRCVSTFLDLFIRLGIIYFVVYIITLVMDSNSDSYNLFLSTTGDPTGFTKKLLTVILILGLLMFAKKAPDLLKEVLPQGIGGNDYGFSLGKRFDNMVGGKAIRKIPKAAAAMGLVAAARGVNAVGTAKNNISRDKAAILRRDVDAYRKSEEAILDNLNNEKITKAQARKQLRDLNKNYSTLAGIRRYGGLNSETAEGIQKELKKASSAGVRRGAVSTAWRTASGLAIGARGGYKNGISSTLKNTFSQNMDYSKYASSGAGLSDLVREYGSAFTGYSAIGTDSYYGNLKYDIERTRKALQDNSSGAKSALNFNNSVEAASGDFDKKNPAVNSAFGVMRHMRIAYQDKITQVESALQNPSDPSSIEILRRAGILEVNAAGDKINRKTGAIVQDAELSNLLTDHLTNLKIESSNIQKATDYAYRGAAISKSLLSEDAAYAAALSAAGLNNDRMGNSAVDRAREEFVTSVMGRKDALLTTAGINFIGKKLDTETFYTNYELFKTGLIEEFKAAGKSELESERLAEQLATESSRTTRVVDASGVVHSFTIEKNAAGKLVLSDGTNSYDGAQFIEKVKNLSGNEENFVKNLSTDYLLQDACGAWLKQASADFAADDQRIAAELADIDNSVAISQQKAAAAYLQYMKALQDVHRYSNGNGYVSRGSNNGSGPPPGGPQGGSPSGGPPLGGPPAGGPPAGGPPAGGGGSR